MRRLADSKALEAAYESAKDLLAVGAISHERFLELEEMCQGALEPPTPKKIAALRKREQLSQARFAYAVGVSVSAVRAWEKGTHRPSGASTRMLNLIDRKGLSVVL